MTGDFSSRLFLSSATCLNLVNAEFLCAGFFFRAVRVGDALYVAVAQILILLSYGHSSDDATRGTAIAVDVNVLS